MASSSRKDAPNEKTIEPLYWLRSLDSGEHYPVHAEEERANLETRGYVVVDSPSAKHVPAPAAPSSTAAAPN